MKRREIQQVSNILDAVLAKYGVARAPDMARVKENWASLAGESWGERTEPLRLTDGDLLVEVPDGTTAAVLRYQIPALIEGLTDALGAGIVSSVTLRVARPSGR